MRPQQHIMRARARLSSARVLERLDLAVHRLARGQRRVLERELAGGGGVRDPQPQLAARPRARRRLEAGLHLRAERVEVTRQHRVERRHAALRRDQALDQPCAPAQIGAALDLRLEHLAYRAALLHRERAIGRHPHDELPQRVEARSAGERCGLLRRVIKRELEQRRAHLLLREPDDVHELLIRALPHRVAHPRRLPRQEPVHEQPRLAARVEPDQLAIVGGPGAGQHELAVLIAGARVDLRELLQRSRVLAGAALVLGGPGVAAILPRLAGVAQRRVVASPLRLIQLRERRLTALAGVEWRPIGALLDAAKAAQRAEGAQEQQRAGMARRGGGRAVDHGRLPGEAITRPVDRARGPGAR